MSARYKYRKHRKQGTSQNLKTSLSKKEFFALDPGEFLLGIDIGGTNVKYGLVSVEGEILSSSESNVSFDRYETPIMKTVLKSVKHFLTHRHTNNILISRYGEPLKPKGIGISTTGQIDVEKGIVAGTCGNPPGWQATALKEIFEEKFSLPTTAANDGNCMILGEAWKGAAQNYKNVVGITLGTGLGGGIIIEGKMLSGTRGFAGELGHIPLYAWGKECTCGLKGCAEQYISVSALHRRSHEIGQSFSNARRLCQDIKQGKIHPDLLALFNQWIDDIALFLAGMVHAFNPQLLLIGGGISRQEDLVIRPLQEKVEAAIMPGFRGSVRLQAAELGNKAGLLGACKFWLEQEKEGYFTGSSSAVK